MEDSFEFFDQEAEGELSEEDEEVIARLRKLDQDRVNDTRREWQAMYGFDHECSCGTDTEEGKVVQIPMCYAGAAAEAFENLRHVRAFLYAIATSPSKEASILKTLAAEAFNGA